MPDIFISYSRRDSEFVRRLVEALRGQQREVWVDFDDIPFGSDWWQEIVEGIERSNAAIFCISPDSIASEVCSLEIAEIIQSHKKLVPILVRPLEDSSHHLPAAISHLNWIFFDKPEAFADSLRALLQTIDTNLDIEKDKTRLLIRTREWENKGHNNSMLLRGEELAAFLPLLADDKLPDEQRTYLETSRHHELNRQQLLRFAFGFLGGVLAMGFYVFVTFRSDNFISPKRLTLTLAGGEIFGFFIGALAVFGQGMLLQIKERLPKISHLPIQIVVCLSAGVLAWVMFQGVILEFWPGLTLPILLGGTGLASAFIINAILKPPPILTLLIAFIGIYLPIWALNNFGQVIQAADGTLNPLIYFDFSRPQDMYWIGIPMALLLAIGANGQLLWQAWQNSQYQRKRNLKANV